jgi:hypothetical protein
MVLRAVRDNRPMVVTDGSLRQVFMDTYVNVVMDAFDEADAFDREAASRRVLKGGPETSATGA